MSLRRSIHHAFLNLVPQKDQLSLQLVTCSVLEDVMEVELNWEGLCSPDKLYIHYIIA